MIYGNGITNTVDSFIVNQLGMPSPNRVILSFVLIAILISVMLFSEKSDVENHRVTGLSIGVDSLCAIDLSYSAMECFNAL